MSLMISDTPDNFRVRRNIKKKDTDCNGTVIPRHRMVLELHMAGHSINETVGDKPSICELSGYTVPSVYRILASKEVNGLRQQIMRVYDQEFESIFPDIIQVVKDGIKPQEEIKDRMTAAKLWLKAHGRSNGSGSGSGSGSNSVINVTAEDVVFQILNRGEAGTETGTETEVEDQQTEARVED